MNKLIGLIIIILFSECRVLPQNQLTTSISEIKNKKGIVLYTFERHIHHFPPSAENKKETFCLVNCELFFKNGMNIPLLDSYEWNYFIRELIKDDKQLTKKIKELILTENELFLPPISNSSIRKEKLYPERRLSDTKHKFELGNINGYLVIESDAIFTKYSNHDTLYISFNIESDFIYYRNLNQFLIKNTTAYKPDLICRLGNHFFQDDFIVIDKVHSTSNLSETQVSSMGMRKHQTNRIEIPVGE